MSPERPRQWRGCSGSLPRDGGCSGAPLSNPECHTTRHHWDSHPTSHLLETAQAGKLGQDSGITGALKKGAGAPGYHSQDKT